MQLHSSTIMDATILDTLQHLQYNTIHLIKISIFRKFGTNKMISFSPYRKLLPLDKNWPKAVDFLAV